MQSGPPVLLVRGSHRQLASCGNNTEKQKPPRLSFSETGVFIDTLAAIFSREL